MRNPTTIRLSEKCRIALLLFAAMLAVVILVFPSTVEVSAEDTEELLSSGIYTIDNVYLKKFHGSYGSYYLRNENGTVGISTNTYGDISDNLGRYWYFEKVSTNQYRIHSMADYSKVLWFSGNDAVLTSSSSTAVWTISESSYGYQLICSSNNVLLSAITTPTLQMHPSDNNYFYATGDALVGAVADMEFDAWNITPVSIGGLYFQNTSTGDLYETFSKTYNLNESTVTLAEMGYTVKLLGEGGLTDPNRFVWVSGNTSVAEVDSSGTVTLKNAGQTQITFVAIVDETQLTASYTLTVQRTGNVYVQFSYDMGYVNASRSGSEAITATRSRIENALRNQYFPAVATAFAEQCGVNLAISSVSHYTSDADTCPNPDTDGHCGCLTDTQCVLKYFDSPYSNNSTNGYEYGVHCRSFTRLRNNLILGLPSNTIRVTYSGYKLCFYSTTKGHHHEVEGLADYNYPIICMNTSQSNSSRNILVLAHEITHTYGIEHHDEINGQSCVMANSLSSMNSDDYSSFWCNSCKNTIRNHS